MFAAFIVLALSLAEFGDSMRYTYHPTLQVLFRYDFDGSSECLLQRACELRGEAVHGPVQLRVGVETHPATLLRGFLPRDVGPREAVLV